MENFPNKIKTAVAIAGVATLGYLGIHHKKQETNVKDNKPKGLEALSPAKYADMQSRIQGELVTGYWANISANKNPTSQESEARARQIAQGSGVKDALTATSMFVKCESGVPVEIQINGAPIPINVGLYNEIELSRINGDNLARNTMQQTQDSLKRQSSPSEGKNTGKAFISNPDDF
jgi:hypothetical protein